MSSYALELTAILDPKRVLTAREDLLTYGFDGTAALQGEAGVVVLPRTTEEVAKIVRYAAREKIPIVSRGSGTGLSGGSIPTPDAIVLCLVKMDRVLELDEKNLTILAEAGTITQKITETADAVGLLYPPDPGSMKISTIGGNVAENSGGLRGLKYGITRDYVMGMEVVLASGEVVWLGNKCVKDVAGYSMKDIFIGSEGTLGIITKILLKLVPKPAAKKTLLATYATMDAAADTVSAIIAAKIIPCTVEFLDRITIKCVEDFAKIGLPLDAEAILFMETDGHPVVIEEQAKQMEEIARRCGAKAVQIAANPEEAAKLATARRSAFSALARVSPTTILEDATVPRSELTKMIRFIQDVGARHQLRIGTFGHMGDGNLHPTFLTDERNTVEMERVEIAMKEIFDYAIALGGTITGEHGVGLAKKRFLPEAIGEASLTLMRKLKRTLDPDGILNPGKIFDELASIGRPHHLAHLDFSVLQQCIHCGMCLPTCPTYDATKLERNSPRGRIALMRNVAEGKLEVTKAFGEELYFCLGCLACETACPAGVNYARMFEEARADIEEAGVLRYPQRIFVRAFALRFVFAHPLVLRALGRVLRWYQASGAEWLVRKLRLTALLPRDLRELEPLTPRVQRDFSDALIGAVESPAQPRHRVGMLTGCVQDLVYPHVNRDTVDVLLANGCEVVTPAAQYCCGSLHAHNGELVLARDMARKNIDDMERAAASLENLDAIITNAAGCGSHLKHYDELLAGDARYAERARTWSRKLKDIHEWLADIGITPAKTSDGSQLSTLNSQLAVTYHEACHLCHGQKITQAPRAILKAIPGLKLVELPESTWCCGSAGIYNITQPEMSRELLQRKMHNIAQTGAKIVATANPGCSVQLEAGARANGQALEIVHPITLLARAYRKGGAAS